MAAVPTPTLSGEHVRLEPLRPEHVAPLVGAASEDRSTYELTNVPTNLAAMEQYVREALSLKEVGLVVPFATVDLARARIVGATRFLNLERWTWTGPRQAGPSVDFDAAEIGATWLAASAQRTAVNTEAKLLMLRLAFREWRLHRINLRTDARNLRSRRAIERVGAKLDGVLRAHMPAFDSGIRDTASYSILASEFPAVEQGLIGRLAQARR